MGEAQDLLRQPGRQTSAQAQQVLLLGRLQTVSQRADRLARPALAGQAIARRASPAIWPGSSNSHAGAWRSSTIWLPTFTVRLRPVVR